MVVGFTTACAINNPNLNPVSENEDNHTLRCLINNQSYQ